MNIVTIKPELERIKDELEKIDALLSNFQEIMNYRLVVKKGNGYFQYWYRDEENKLIYIPAKEKSFAKELVQKDYYLKIKKTLLQQKRTIETFCSDGLADRAARPRAQSVRPHRAFCRGLVRVSACRALLAQRLRAQQDSGGVLRRDDDRRHGWVVGDHRMALCRYRRRLGGGGVPRFAGRRMGRAEGHPLRYFRRGLFSIAVLVVQP